MISIYNGRKEGKKGGCEVLDIGSENLSWRPLEISNFANLNRKRETITTKSIIVLGFMRMDQAIVNSFHRPE